MSISKARKDQLDVRVAQFLSSFNEDEKNYISSNFGTRMFLEEHAGVPRGAYGANEVCPACRRPI